MGTISKKYYKTKPGSTPYHPMIVEFVSNGDTPSLFNGIVKAVATYGSGPQEYKVNQMYYSFNRDLFTEHE